MFKRTPLYRSNFREATNIAAVSSLDEMKELVDALYNQDRLIGFDIETGYLGSDYPKRSLNMYHPDQLIAGFSITNDPTWARYVPLRHDFANNLDPNEVWPLMKPLLEEKPKVAHNLQFEAENLLQLDKKGDGPRINIFASPVHDSMIQAFTLSDVPPMNIDGSLDGGKYVEAFLPPFHRTGDMFAAPNLKWFNVGLKDLTRFRYNYEQNDIFTLFNGGKPLTQKQKDCIRFNTLPVDSKVVRYAGDDAYLCLMLHYDQIERINEDPYLPNVYQLEMQIAELLVEIREVGVAVDWEGIAEHKQIFETFSHNMRVSTKEKFEEELGRELLNLNLNSPVQIRKLIFDSPEEGGMGLTTERVTKSGLLSTDDQALTNLRQMSPAIDSLLKYRQCVKMGKWFDQWDELSSQYEDRRLHPSFNQVQVQSGRFASSNPNCLQGDVEVLTSKGWVTLENLQDGESIVQVNEAGESSFVVPSQVVRLPFKGEGVRLRSHRGKGWMDLWMTPDHRVLSYNREGNPMWDTAQDWLDKWEGTKIIDRKFRRGTFLQGGRELTPDERDALELAVASQADGSRSGLCWSVSVRKDRKVERLRRLGMKVTWYPERGTGVSRIPRAQVDEWVGEDKSFKVDNILSLCSEDLDFFVGAVMRWDGDNSRGNTYSQHPDRARDVDVVQAAAALSGKSTSRYEYHRRDLNGDLVDTPYNTLNVNYLDLRHASRLDITSESFEGVVYCVTVPTGAFLIRSNGTVLTTGNCQNITKRWWYQNVPGSAADIMATGKQGSEYWTGNARDFIKASEGYTLLSFDYKSAEIQMLAALSRETEIIKAFYADEDFHKWTASLVFGKPIEEVTKNERQAAKTTAFATIYGQSVGATAQQLGVSREEAQRIRDLYFSRFPRLAQYIEDQHTMVQNECEVRTWLGRRATIWENMHPTRAVRSKAARMSVNIPVQGGATGDYPKLAMIRVRKLLKSLGWWNGMVRLLMNQHDSLVFEVSNQLDLQEVIDLLTPQVQFSLAGIQNCFNQFDTFPPMSVDWEAGKRWGSIVSIEDLPILDAHELVVELAEDATAADLKAVKSVLVSSPGDVPVVLKVRGKEIRDKFKVAATPSIPTRLKKGDSDLGIYHAIGDRVTAEFLVPA